MFQVSHISKHFGGVKAVSDVSFSVAPGKVLACVGPNAAGKTTLLNLVSGWHRPDEGLVRIDQQEIHSFSPEVFASLGVARTFQRARLFRKRTVIENLLLASRQKSDETIRAAMFKGTWLRREKEESERADEILESLGIAELAHRPAQALSGGEQRLVELAVAAMRQPKVLVLDEPVANLSQESRQKVVAFLLRQRESNVCCILVEHDLSFVRQIADEILVLARGAVVAIGSVSSTQAFIESSYSLTHPTEPVGPPTTDSPNGTKDSGGTVELLSSNANEALVGRTVTSSYSRCRAHMKLSGLSQYVRVGMARFRKRSAIQGESDRSKYEPLTVRGLCVDYGNGPVIEDVTLDVRPGEIVALVGGNGSGKSTTMRAILGLLKYRGSVCLGKRSLTSVPPYVISRLGISYVAQHRKVFPSLTVLENLLIASDNKKQVAEDRLQPALEAFPELSQLLGECSGALSGGQQQMVAIARALLQRPRLLLLDEPSAGLSEYLWARLWKLIVGLAESGLPIMLVEHRPIERKSLSKQFFINDGRMIAHSQESSHTI
jgi:branched-chain amino acid transport system ATP-binding protein